MLRGLAFAVATAIMLTGCGSATPATPGTATLRPATPGPATPTVQAPTAAAPGVSSIPELLTSPSPEAPIAGSFDIGGRSLYLECSGRG
ncbi:MAG TPA: hypothetical protein VFW02_11300, partial [Candidatus Limnocylindrales bacterium]|nr:hypothetical protein [Candidatus Limnocylindrales bacterium]